MTFAAAFVVSLQLAGTAAPPPGTPAIGDGEATFRALFGGEDGPAQVVPRRWLPDAVEVDDTASPGDATVRDTAVAGEGDVPVTTADVGGRSGRWRFVLAGDLLVVARTAPDYRLLDALSVRTDPGGRPSLHTGTALADDVPAVLVTNSHFNSQEGFAAHTLIAFVDGQLRPVWDGPLLYSVQYADGECEERQVWQGLTRFDVAATTPWPTIEIVYSETEICQNGDEPAMPRRHRDFAATLRLDETSGRYVGRFPDLEALNDERRGVGEE